MPYLAKIVLHCPTGMNDQLESLVKAFMQDGVKFVAVAGKDANLIEDVIDELCVGDGSNSYEMLTSSHPDESLETVVAFAESLDLEFSGPVDVVEL